MKIEDIILDLDDVNLQFVEQMVCEFGVQYSQITQWRWNKILGVSDDEFRQWLRSRKRSWWEARQPQPWAKGLVAFCQTLAPTMIATARSFSGAAAGGVRDWVTTHLGIAEDAIMIGARKHKLAAPGRVLVDDNDTNVDKFIEAGGAGIVFPRPWNRERDRTATAFAYVTGELARLVDDPWQIRICDPQLKGHRFEINGFVSLTTSMHSDSIEITGAGDHYPRFIPSEWVDLTIEVRGAVTKQLT